MCHREASDFVRLVLTGLSNSNNRLNVIEIGSHDVNGTVRNLFPSTATYLGVDLAAGPGVDRIGYGHLVDDPDGSYDIAVSVECFEHDPHWPLTLQNMVRLVRPGGLLIVTCASAGRPEHGTFRSDPSLSPGTQQVGLDHYENVELARFAAALVESDFDKTVMWYNKRNWDLYFSGIRAAANQGEPIASLPSTTAISEIGKNASLIVRVHRVPLRLAYSLLDGDRYQSFAVRYELFTKKLRASRMWQLIRSR